MIELGIDIETTSNVSLIESGVYKYVESEGFRILLFAYSINGDKPIIVDLTKDELPKHILKSLNDPTIIKTAWNANFERVCINKFFGLNIPASQWDCTMVRASLLGYPLSLDAVGKIIGKEIKDKEGKALIKLFSEKQTDKLLQPDKWLRFCNYCLQDVVVEQSIRKTVIKYPIPQFERNVWLLDQKLNDRGIEIDKAFVKKALDFEAKYSIELAIKAKHLTGLDNPNSVAQLKKWIYIKTNIFINSLSKETKVDTDDKDVLEMLKMRTEMSKTSNKKYRSMLKGLCIDNRVRGILQYNGANRTGRWAGRLIQVHNLVRNSMHDLDTARKALNCDVLDILYDTPNSVLSQLIRTAFIAGKNKTFIISDFSAIEARVVAWLSKEKWRLDVFATHGKIYEASASKMFNIPIEQITKGSDLRTKGKIAELALGYQGAVGALERMGGAQMGLSVPVMLNLVKSWRRSNRSIVKFWYDINNVVLDVIRSKRARQIQCLKVLYEDNILFIELPSKRRLAYLEAKIKIDSDGEERITYKGMDQTTKQWVSVTTYGGKLTENIVQAIARDCLADKMLLLDKHGFDLVMHVHDEVVIEVPEKNSAVTFEKVNALMKSEISWAPGLPLGAESFISKYYKKD